MGPRPQKGIHRADGVRRLRQFSLLSGNDIEDSADGAQTRAGLDFSVMFIICSCMTFLQFHRYREKLGLATARIGQFALVG